jgi:hypothetical protein
MMVLYGNVVQGMLLHRRAHCRREIKLTSVLNLRKEVLDNINYSLKDILQNFTYVGAVDRTWSIIQHKTELYVCNNELVL